MQELEDVARANGIDIPLTHNAPNMVSPFAYYNDVLNVSLTTCAVWLLLVKRLLQRDRKR
jgi:hypothetical protein